jgi:glycosyltransferase involved in cell wall biosynthesis
LAGEQVKEEGNPVALVTAVVTTYNRSAQACRAVQSVREQDYPHVEILVVDDGSTDDTPHRLGVFQNRIYYIYRRNKGVSAARNTGIRLSRGKYIAFLDSDDLWQPEKTARQVAYLETHLEFRACQVGEIWFRRGRRVNPKKIHCKPSGWIFRESLRLCTVSPSAVMVRRDLFEDVGLFDESLPACEDYDLWLRISSREPIALLPDSLVTKYGGHPDQLSRMTPCLDRYRIRSIVKVLEYGNLTDEQFAAAVSELDRKCAIFAAGCLKRGRADEAAHYRGLPERYRSRGNHEKTNDSVPS